MYHIEFSAGFFSQTVRTWWKTASNFMSPMALRLPKRALSARNRALWPSRTCVYACPFIRCVSGRHVMHSCCLPSCSAVLFLTSRPSCPSAFSASGSQAPRASAPRKVDFSRLEEIIAEDHGQRGIGPLVIRGELARAAYHLSHGPDCQHIAIVTGYPCCPGSPPTETDGPPGAIATARALVALGHRVTILTDECNEVRAVKARGPRGVEARGDVASCVSALWIRADVDIPNDPAPCAYTTRSLSALL